MNALESKLNLSSDEIGLETKHSNNPYLRTLRLAIENKDTVGLRVIIDAIQKQIHKLPKVDISPMHDTDLQELIETGKGAILVGTGTYGERMFIENGELFMPQARDQKSSQQFYNNFRYIFEIPEGQELRVKF